MYHRGTVYSREFTTVVLVPKAKFNLNLSKELIKKQQEIFNLVKNEDQDGYDDLLHYTKDNVLIGIGKSNTKKSSEQMCSKNCLINLDITIEY